MLRIVAIHLAKMSGFDPIITTSSAHNTPYCEAAGATHVIDYHKTPYGPEFTKAVSEIIAGNPLKVIYNCTFDEASQLACWSLLSSGGRLILAAASNGARGLVKECNEEDEQGRMIVTIFASPHSDEVGGDARLGKSLFGALEKMLRDGDLKPSKVELVPGGLSGVGDALGKLASKKVSGAKLVARIADTPV